MRYVKESRRRVVVLNQFALPLSEAGGTRHVELFSQLGDWKSLIVSGDRNHAGQRRFISRDPLLVTVPVPESSGGPVSRLVTWLLFCMRAAKLVLREGPFAVVYGSSPQLFVPLTGLILAKLTRARFILEVRDLWPESFVSAGLMRKGSAQYRVFRLIELLVSRSADHIVVVTDGWDSHFRQMGIPESRMTVVPNGSDPKPSRAPLSREAELALRELKDAGCLRIGIFAGTHGPKDGIHEILRAARAQPQIGVLLMGEGSVKAEAQLEAADLANVRFLSAVPKEGLFGVLGETDFGIHSVSGLDVFAKGMSPNKLFDYMAARLPIVSNAGPGVERVIGQFEIGYVGTNEGLIEGFEIMLEVPDVELRRLGENAHRLLVEKYSRQASAERLRNVLDGVVSA